MGNKEAKKEVKKGRSKNQYQELQETRTNDRQSKKHLNLLMISPEELLEN